VPGDDAVVAIDENRVGETELDDRCGNPGDLRVGVRAGVGNQGIDRAVLDVERAQSGNPKSKTRRASPPGGLGEGRFRRGGNRGR